MTPQQQRAVVAERIAHGFPRHKPPHPRAPEGWYFITGACYEHRQHFQRADELTALQRRLFEAFEESGSECGGWVVMPNHYHALLRISSFEGFGRAIGKVHGRSAFYANGRDSVRGRQVWYKYADRAIRSERHYWTCLHYIVMNPVKHGFARQATEWAWSCIHELLDEHGAEWVADLRREFPLREFGREWDNWHIGQAAGGTA
jgi:putative transposase